MLFVRSVDHKHGRKAHTRGGTAIALGGGMWLDAVVTSKDLQRVVDQLTPATIPLGARGHLYFDAPAEISLVADRGLRIRCHAKVLWPVLGIDVALTIRSMTIVVVPSIETRDGNRVVVFSPEVDALDLALLPDVGDDELRAYINRELMEQRIELPWNYKETLDHQFALPAWFPAGSIFEIRSNGASIKVTNDSIGLAIGIDASVATDEDRRRALRNGDGSRHGSNGTPVPRKSSPRPAQTASDSHRGRVGLAFAVASGFALGCLVGLRHAGR
jgi:hypothetical protein